MAALPSTKLAVDLMMRTSTNAQAFRIQSGAQQREFLELVVESATWKRGELRMLLRGPFEKIPLSNSLTPRKENVFDAEIAKFDNWR